MANANNNITGTGPKWMAEQQTAQGNKANQWTQMLQMMNMANKMTDRQMMGFALGRLLRDGFNNWKDKYEERDYQKQMAAKQANKAQAVADSMPIFPNEALPDYQTEGRIMGQEQVSPDDEYGRIYW